MAVPDDPSGRPRLVLVHGTRLSAAQWDPYPTLLPTVEVVAVDLPGHGERLAEQFTVDAALAVIGEAVRGAAGRPVVLAGHSLGGYLASLWASRHPDALAGLVLIGATADPAGRVAFGYRGFARVLSLVGPHRMHRLSDAVMRLLGAGTTAAGTDVAAYAALPAAWQAVVEHCGPHLLAGPTCPVLLVNGQWDQMRVDVARHAAAARRARVITVRRATHLLPLTHPVEVAGILSDAVAVTPPAARP